MMYRVDQKELKHFKPALLNIVTMLPEKLHKVSNKTFTVPTCHELQEQVQDDDVVKVSANQQLSLA